MGAVPNYTQEESRLGGWNILGADWESGAIVKVAELNGLLCLILRGVSDIPESHPAGPDAFFEDSARASVAGHRSLF
jgi:nucleoside phosphorylase